MSNGSPSRRVARASVLVLALGALAAAILVFGGCGGDTSTAPESSPPIPESGLRGRVLSVGGPVMASDKSPYAATEITVLDDGGKVVARITPETDGRFRIPLPPGAYAVKARPTRGNPWFLPYPPVEVRAGHFTKVMLYAQMR
jgi:hypothetical protein